MGLQARVGMQIGGLRVMRQDALTSGHDLPEILSFGILEETSNLQLSQKGNVF